MIFLTVVVAVIGFLGILLAGLGLAAALLWGTRDA